MKFTEEELNRLTPDERAAVEADDNDEDLQLIADGGLDDGDAPDGDNAGEQPNGDAPANDKPVDKDPAGILSADDDTPIAPFTAKPVEDYEGKVAAAETKRTEAFQKMMDGDLSAAEYQAIEKQANSEIRDLDAQQNEFRVAESMTKQAQTNAWLTHVNTTLDASKAAGADLTSDPAIAAELNRTVKLLAAQVQEDPTMLKGIPVTKPGALVTNADKWILKEAISIVAARNNLKLGKTADPAPTNKNREPDLSKVPPNLSSIPASAEQNIGTDEFAHIHKLSGSDYEKAVARLTPDQLDRFMA
ncbi:MAG: hypothetical protein QE279_10120 [Rhodoferax sp.]|nr:hypothetical protein [Rhodoferax sp.]